MRRPLVAALLAGGVAVALGSCGGARPDPGPTSTAGATGPASGGVVVPDGVPGFPYDDPDRVCRAFVTAMLGSDTTTDATPLDAFGRASAFMTQAVNTAPPERGDARWTLWVGHRARVEVVLEDWFGELPADAPTEVTRAVIATATPVGVDGWRGPAERQAVYCALARVGEQWRVSGHDTDDLGSVGS